MKSLRGRGPRAVLGTFVTWLVVGASAQAQEPGSWLVLGAATDDEQAAVRRWIDAAESRLREAGREVLPHAVVAERLQASLSAPFEPTPAAVSADIGQAVEPALEHVAFGRNVEARAAIEPVLVRAEPYLAGIGRDAQTSTDLVNLCLFAVRSHLQQRDVDAARTRARDCLRIRPDLRAAGSDVHPPAVRELFEQVRHEIEDGQEGAASIVVQLRAGNDRRCVARLNGRPIGDTPAARRFVPEGEYAVDLECREGVPGRVHRVRAARGSPTRVVIDPELEAALRGDPTVLVYGEALPVEETLIGHARAVGEAANATGVLVVTVEAGAAQIRRIPTLARARLASDPTDREMAEALDALLAGRSFGFGSSGEGGTDPGSGDGRRRRPIVGPVLLGVAGLGGVAVVIGSVVRAGCVERNATGFCTEEDELKVAPVALYGATGGAAVIGAMLWLVLGRRGGEDARVGIGPGTVDLEVSF